MHCELLWMICTHTTSDIKSPSMRYVVPTLACGVRHSPLALTDLNTDSLVAFPSQMLNLSGNACLITKCWIQGSLVCVIGRDYRSQFCDIVRDTTLMERCSWMIHIPCLYDRSRSASRGLTWLFGSQTDLHILYLLRVCVPQVISRWTEFNLECDDQGS